MEENKKQRPSAEDRCFFWRSGRDSNWTGAFYAPDSVGFSACFAASGGIRRPFILLSITAQRGKIRGKNGPFSAPIGGGTGRQWSGGYTPPVLPPAEQHKPSCRQGQPGASGGCGGFPGPACTRTAPRRRKAAGLSRTRASSGKRAEAYFSEGGDIGTPGRRFVSPAGRLQGKAAQRDTRQKHPPGFACRLWPR